VNEFGNNVERHRRELLVRCYRMLGSLPDAEDAVRETMLRAWRYGDSLKQGAPLRPWLCRVATNACLDAIARDQRRAVLGARAEADDGWAGQPVDVVWLGPIPDSVLEPHPHPSTIKEALETEKVRNKVWPEPLCRRILIVFPAFESIPTVSDPSIY
jgi:DNA-directed RNA polymerase specialized sigma24 family protein